MPRSLIYYWRINLAVVLATAVAAAVITGALLVGDSVRGSLRDLTLDRLGKTDYSVMVARFFREDLAESFNQKVAGHSAGSVPVILLRGAAVNAKTHARASDVNIIGVDERFNQLFGSDLAFEREPGQIFQPTLVNQALRHELAIEPGDQILLSLQRASDIHRESLMGNRDPGDQIETLRLQLTRVLPNQGAGRFSLFPHQAEPLNVFVKLEVLQRAVEEEGQVNALLISAPSTAANSASRQDLQSALRATLTLPDLGLKLVPEGDHLSLQSDQFVLPAWAIEMASAAAGQSLTLQPTSTYLANRIQIGEAVVPYSTLTAVDRAEAAGLPGLQLVDGSPAPGLAEDEILLNEWAAEQLSAKPGDTVEISYYAVGPRDELRTRQASFKLRAVVAMKGLAVDKGLVPEFPGISDAADMSSWSPPFPVDLSLIRPQDEAYWDKYRASPKGFVSLAAGRRLWGSRFGYVTTLRVAASVGNETGAGSSALAAFKQRLGEHLPAQAAGFVLRPVKESGLAAASGPTDFSGLFVSFSFFLVFAATLIVGLLFRLSVERRASEIGLLLSVGHSRRRLLGRFLKEAAILASVGVLPGLGLAALYAGFLMFALRTWWVDAVGTTFLSLHVEVGTLLIGGIIAFLVVVLFTVLAVRKLFRLPKPLLLGGETVVETVGRRGVRARIAGALSLSLAVLLMALSFWAAGSGGWSGGTTVAGFFAVGACILAAGLFFFAAWCRDAGRVPLFAGGTGTFLAMAARNSARNPGRSVLSVALVASACFVIVAVGANRLQPQRGLLPKSSGTGGFALLATSEIPVLKDLSSPDARLDLGFSAAESRALQEARVFPLRLLPGDDTSCLNLYRPEKPRVLGVPQDLMERGGFTVEHAGPSLDNSWTLLEGQIEPGVIPAFGDHESVQWILQLGLGQDLEIQDQAGNPVRLRLVGLIDNSIFQSELLISEENFLRLFPNLSGYSYFLVDAPATKTAAVAFALESGLAPFGFDATPADEKLASFQAVRATYISTFQTLGGLGLLLGTFGLAVILIRNVIERRGELATLRAFGFRRRGLAAMVLAENAFLLLLGILLGTIAALIAVTPNLAGGAAQVPWLSLLATLAAIVAVGMLASAAAVRLALRIPMLPALKAE